MKKYLYLFAIPFILAACSEANTFAGEEEDDDSKGPKEELRINAGMSSSILVTRADDDPPAFTKDFDLFLTQSAPASPVFLTAGTYNAVYNTSNYQVKDGSNTIIYWDNIGGTDATLDLQGIYPKGSGYTVNSPSFNWAVEDVQSDADKVDASDLLISDKITGYALNDQKTSIKNLPFRHVLSKLTFILKGGDGFTTSDFTPSLTISSLKIAGTVTMATESKDVVVSPSGNATDITPCPVSGAGTLEQTLEAIIIPGQTISTTDVFATINITIGGKVNTYLVKLDEDVELLPGVNHQFEITVTKTGTTIVATLKEWETGDPISKTVSIDVSDKNVTNGVLADGASLYIKIDDVKRIFTYTKNPEKWTPDSPIYWDDVNWRTDLYSDAILYNGSVLENINTDPENIYKGKSGELDDAYQLIPYEDLKHPFSKLNITIQTPKKEDFSVDLTKLRRITFNADIKRFVKIVIDTETGDDFETITYENADLAITDENIEEPKDDPTYNTILLSPIYIEPVTIAADSELLRLFYEDNPIENEYPLKLTSAIEFKENQEYNITITLHKTEIAEVGVSIEGWGRDEDDDISGNAGINK